MDTTTINALISAGVGAGIVVLKDIIVKIIDCIKSKNISTQQLESEYRDKKEKVYIEAINFLSFIRMGFDYTTEDLNKSSELIRTYKEQVNRYNNVSASIKLYSTDKIIFEFEELKKYIKYSFVKPSGERLLEESKISFSNKILILSRLMQKDLGIRELSGSDNLELICPNCGTKHDHVDKCPKCNLTVEEALAKVNEKEAKQAKKLKEKGNKK